MGNEWYEATLGDLLSFSNGRTSPRRSNSWPHPVYGSNGIIGFSNEANAEKNTIIVGRVGSYCGSLYYSDGDCWVTDNAIRANAIDEHEAKFLFFLLQTLSLNDRRVGSGQPLLNQTILSSIPVTVPPLPEQKTIADYLDRKTEQIDTLTEKKQKQIELLKEQRAAIINRAVTKGLNPDVTMKDSGIEWLGEIPATWQMSEWKEIELDNIAELVKDKYTPQKGDKLHYIGLEHIQEQSLKLKGLGNSDEITSDKFHFNSGDILFGKLRPYLRKVIIPKFDGVCSTDIWVVRSKIQKYDINQRYLFYLFTSKEFVDLSDSSASGTRMPRADWKFMRNTIWDIPINKTEQKAIADYLDRKTEQIDTLTEKKQKQIELLSEYRTTLITNAVTGTIDIRNEVE